PGSKNTYPELSIEDYGAEIRAGRPDELVDMATLKVSHDVRVIVDGGGDRRQHRRLYECFVYELVDDGKTYVLFAGHGVCVDRKFHKDVEKAFSNVLSKNPFLGKTDAATEQELIKDLDADCDLLNLDQVKLSPSGAAGANLEPCDFLSRTKQFIHLKDGGSSAPISHLWNQGVVSAESFVRDSTFRGALRKEVLKR